MNYRPVLLAGLLWLGGCADPALMEARAQKWLAEELAEDEAICARQGHAPGTPAGQACLQREGDRRAERKAREEAEERERIKAEMEYVDPRY